jgi:hypothetical protein
MTPSIGKVDPTLPIELAMRGDERFSRRRLLGLPDIFPRQNIDPWWPLGNLSMKSGKNPYRCLQTGKWKACKNSLVVVIVVIVVVVGVVVW